MGRRTRGSREARRQITKKAEHTTNWLQRLGVQFTSRVQPQDREVQEKAQHVLQYMSGFGDDRHRTVMQEFVKELHAARKGTGREARREANRAKLKAKQEARAAHKNKLGARRHLISETPSIRMRGPGVAYKVQTARSPDFRKKVAEVLPSQIRPLMPETLQAMPIIAQIGDMIVVEALPAESLEVLEEVQALAGLRTEELAVGAG